jgi:AAA domain, putative AbiEii toxin, Type IV TA system
VIEADFLPAERVSIITGDNGLGKTFLLECCWWSLTGEWAERQALPHDPSRPASIEFVIASKDDFPARKAIQFDYQTFRWPAAKERPTIPGLVVYARVDGSFAVWDPVRHYDDAPRETTPGFFLFSRENVLDGLGNKIEGLIRDWVRWQNAKDQSLFTMFCKVLERLSPPDMAPLSPGEPIRIAQDSRDFPTLLHDYGTVPFLNESAGVRRIVAIAYLLVWAWNEHRVYASLSGRTPQDYIVLMIDEIEAHLHPKWQRVILPALLDVTNLLSDQMKSQVIVATHSPLILASMENAFSQERDKLFHLYLDKDSNMTTSRVGLDELDYFKHGSVDAWLTSEIFELKEARSQEGESALQQAERLLQESVSSPQQITRVHEILKNALPAEDPFWPRWLHFAEMKGVKL